MKLFITGGTGFVGSHLINQAHAAGHTLVAQRRPGSQSRLKLDREPQWVDRALDGDFTAELEGCDAVVHLASHTPNPPYAPLDECLYWNVFAAVHLLQQAAALGIRDVLVAGTCFEYGEAAQGLDVVPPATDMRPSLSYPISKAAATTACLGLARHLGLRLQVLRIFQVFGDGEAATRFWPSLRAAALEGRDFAMSAGVQVRDFIPVQDVARQFLAALDFSQVEPGRPQVRNVGTGHGQTLLAFAQHWWAHWQATGQLVPGQVGLRPGELPRLVADMNSVHIA
ncbi:NAD-dependent epimerase/dehydratase family protein [Roseateles depolymerans]|uniref:Nucleoside-diphosphate-sugar epimerase n=1 Tax=Roseateles depolymerans TaxID=76731 RepID=A0A0U3MVU8_9BURK|nr:NAD(P)-dependent oxidoreductase [Roseateles depolymerans]ALV08490.1 nucleoside-diphosphate-sugar epimerase [Roseateles depolymerans]REG21284.1 dTDP-6-deoxy-L-talose 4-dehydrogenase (NAD+) [Roseateles depolymerans]